MTLVTYKLHDKYTIEKFKSPNFLHVISLCKYFYKIHKVESKCILTTPFTLISSVENYITLVSECRVERYFSTLLVQRTP